MVEALGLGEQGRYLAALTFGNVHGVYKPGNVKLRPEILGQIQPPSAPKYGQDKPLDLVFHGGSGSLLSEIREALDFGVVKMNVDTDTQYGVHSARRRPHVRQLRRRPQRSTARSQQEGVRPARLGTSRPRRAWPSASSWRARTCARPVPRSGSNLSV